MIKRLLNLISTKIVSTISTVLVLVWIIFPIIIMVLNAINFDATITYKIWISLVYIIGCFGLIFGASYFCSLAKCDVLTKHDKVFTAMPYALFLLFGIWCVICTVRAKFVFVSIFGCWVAQDSLSCYLAYAGFIMLGTIVATNIRNVLIVANVTIFVADILAVISLIDNTVTNLLNVNEFTNCFHYQSVYYNTNHYAYYLTIVILLCAFFFIYSKNKIGKLFGISSFIIQTSLLIMNDTMGGYLAVFLTLIIYFVVCLVRKEHIGSAVVVVLTFATVSLASNVFVDNVTTNFINLFENLGTLLDNSSTQTEIDSVGSGRGNLWKYALTVIKKNPIFGVGPNNVYISAHNVYLQIAMYTGIVGLAMYCAPFVARTITMVKTIVSLNVVQKASLFIAMGYIISAFFGVTLFYTAPYFYVIVGIAFGFTQKNCFVK